MERVQEKASLLGTGLSGTIGKHLQSRVSDLGIDLERPVQLAGNSNFRPGSNLIHLAGIVGESRVNSDLAYSNRVNVLSMAELGQEFLENGGGVLFYVSSSHVYAPASIPLNELAALGPSSKYAQQKLEAEEVLQSIFADDPSKLCIIRLFSVLDWGCPDGSLGGAIRYLVQSKSKGIVKTANDVRDFLTPSKIGDTLIEIADAGISGVLNLCSSQPLTIRDATKKMLEARGWESEGIVYEESNSPRPFLVGDNSKLLALLPHISIDWRPSSLGEV
jgi:nucleoside-diphosphate-sugar epimerase